MSVISIFVASSIFLTAMNLQVVSGSLVDPKADESHYRNEVLADSIPLEAGEKVLVAPGSVAASSAVVLTNVPVELAYSTIKRAIEKTAGIASEKQSVSEVNKVESRDKANEFMWAEWPIFGDDFAKLKALGFQFNPPREYLIKTKLYNKLEKLRGSSETEYRIVEGKPIWGSESTLIIIRRIDVSREWARMWEGLIPLPFKVEAKHHLVTTTELDLIENSIGSFASARVKCFTPLPFYTDKEYWQEFFESISKAIREFPDFHHHLQ